MPLEIIVLIAFNLQSWNDIHNFSFIFRELRKVLGFAKHARTIFELERNRTKLIDCPFDQQKIPLLEPPFFGSSVPLWKQDLNRNLAWDDISNSDDILRRKTFWGRIQHDYDTNIIEMGDDRIIVYANPRRSIHTVELWRTKYSWIDYKCDFEKGELTDLSWVYLPYGSNFTGTEYIPTENSHFKFGTYHNFVKRQHLSYAEVIAALRKTWIHDKKIKMPTWIEQKIKIKYDNLYTKMMIKEMSPQPKVLSEKCVHHESHFLRRCYPFMNGFGLDHQVVKNKRGFLKKHLCNMHVPLNVNDFLIK